jgi:D-alanyl-lipoteichoic acid acyltransferase DltB (MBOAT superfamily)
MDFLFVICVLGISLFAIRRIQFLRDHSIWILSGVNAFFLLYCYSLQSFLFLVAFLVVMYGILWLKAVRSAISFRLLIVSIVILFCVFKNYSFLPLGSWHQHIPEVLGLSYVVFRVINLLYDVAQKKTSIPFINYFNYNLSFLTLLAGPIQRYKGYLDDVEAIKDDTLTSSDIAMQCNRVANGLMKVAILAPMVQTLQEGCFQARTTATVAGLSSLGEAVCLMTATLLYLFYLYLNFSGYSDVVIALGRLCGFSLPENFGKPFSSTNFLDYWNHWHISVSSWFRDYCYTPTLKIIIKKGGGAFGAPIIPLFMSFGLLGVWHGRTWPFLFCGLALASGATVNNIFRRAMKQRWGYRYTAIIEDPKIKALSSSLTFMYISLAITGLWLSGDGIVAAYSHITAIQWALGIGIVISVLAVFIWSLRTLYAVPVCQAGTQKVYDGVWGNPVSLTIATKLLIVVLHFFVMDNALPDLVYQSF